MDSVVTVYSSGIGSWHRLLHIIFMRKTGNFACPQRISARHGSLAAYPRCLQKPNRGFIARQLHLKQKRRSKWTPHEGGTRPPLLPFFLRFCTHIRHYSPVCRAAARTDLSVCIGISPLPGSPRAAPIACGVFHARTVAEQKYHDRRYGSWRAPGARRTANVSMLPDMRLSRFNRKCPPISSDKKRANSAVLLAQKDLQFSYAGVNRPPYRTFTNAFRFCYL